MTSVVDFVSLSLSSYWLLSLFSLPAWIIASYFAKGVGGVAFYMVRWFSILVTFFFVSLFLGSMGGYRGGWILYFSLAASRRWEDTCEKDDEG